MEHGGERGVAARTPSDHAAPGDGQSRRRRDEVCEGRKRWHAGPALIVGLMVQAVWLGGCGRNERAAEKDYREAQSAYQRGDLSISLKKSQEGLRKYSRGSSTSSRWGWKFRPLCAENLISTDSVQEAGRLLQTVPGPPASLIARWKLDQANALARQQPEEARKLFYEARKLAAASGDVFTLCLANLRLGALA